ncbi:hypothetical protein DFJ63DRAFT_163065 [Scheffersomyces coipomensis]|uniref:uncharacterized protein n=1 Tax=Scheffersomyces coipomensis TaxID=1788519 RepID=UPI00315DA388
MYYTVKSAIRWYKPLIITARLNSTSTISKPALISILPSKKIINRLLFDNNSRLSYSKTIPILEVVYKNLEAPEEIIYPSKVNGQDLMVLKSVLANIRGATNSINKNLVNLENELVEQAAEMGDNDAIALLMAEVVKKKIVDKKSVTDEDVKYAQTILQELCDQNHLLALKLRADIYFKAGFAEKAEKGWLRYLEHDQTSIQAAQVWADLGLYYFTYQSPTTNLTSAKYCFENAIQYGVLDDYIIKAHYYLGQLYSTIDPEVARYHWEISATRSLSDSFSSLGYLELNTFEDYNKAIEWFTLGVEANNQVVCMIGLFDAYYKSNDRVLAFKWYQNLKSIKRKVQTYKKSKAYKTSNEFKNNIDVSESLVFQFLETRKNEILDISNVMV